MYPVYPARSATAQSAAQPGLHRDVLEAVQAQLAVLDPELDPQSPRGRMAILVMAAGAVGRNIDRLARITKIERETVAKFCRRLFDADIDPAEFGTAHADFWNVVGLAEGRLARRVDEMGRGEWVAAGMVSREVLADGSAGAAPARRDDGMLHADDDDSWASSRGWSGMQAERNAPPAPRDVPAMAAAAVVLFPGAEWLT